MMQARVGQLAGPFMIQPLQRMTSSIRAISRCCTRRTTRTAIMTTMIDRSLQQQRQFASTSPSSPSPSSSSPSSSPSPSLHLESYDALQGATEKQLTSSSPTPPIPSGIHEWDVIIVGGGHNGLVSAAYLSRQGLKVLVLERRYILGGAAITEEIYPGFHYSRASYLFSLFRPKIVEDLQLKRHGLKFLFRDPSSFTPLLNGQSLLMGKDMAFNQSEIAKFSKKDAEQYPLYDAYLTKLTTFFAPYLDTVPPGPTMTWSERKEQMRTLRTVAENAWKLGKEILGFHEVLTAPATRVLGKWFESEPLRSTLATDAVIGAMMSPSTPGSGYVLFHHVMGEVDGNKGAWAYVEGGMGAVSRAIAAAAREAGASLHTNARVSRILIEKGHAMGVVLESGQVLHSKVVLSNATPHVTFSNLMDGHDVPQEYRRQIQTLDTTSPVCKINVSLSSVPNFKCKPNLAPNEPGPQHRGTIHFCEDIQQIEQGYLDALNGRPSTRPLIEMSIPSVLDKTLAPPGKHVASLFVQYAPYHIEGGWTKEAKQNFAMRCFDLIEEYAPGFKDSVLHYECLPPPELERIFGLTGGNIFHHSMGLDQLFWLRGTPYGGPRTPIPGLYMCGAGIHPGGGVMGAAGRNAAKIIGWEMEQLKRIRMEKGIIASRPFP